MKKSTDIAQQSMILEHFSEYLKQHENIEILFSEKFGYIYIALWGVADTASYDAICIESAEHLCDILMDVMVYDYIAMSELLCVSKAEAEGLYHDTIEQYVTQLPAYQGYLKASYAKAVLPLICKIV